MAAFAARPTPRIGHVGIRRSLFHSAIALGVLVASAQSTAAQRGGGDGFLFNHPAGSLTLRGGFARPNTASEVFTFISDTLTLGRRDFDGITFGGSLAIWVNSYMDVVLAADHATQSKRSEFRNWVDEGPTPSEDDDLPIEQTTTFQRTPLTLGLRAYLVPRGRSIGQFAWVPRGFAPYIEVGGGAMGYRFEQEGDFVDFTDSSIFTDTIESEGWTPVVHGIAGFEISLSPRVALTTEGRYSWAEAEMSQDFEGFDRIDLSGVSASLGLTFRF